VRVSVGVYVLVCVPMCASTVDCSLTYYEV